MLTYLTIDVLLLFIFMYSKTAFTTAKLDAAVSHTLPQVAFLKSLHGAFISGCGSQESPGMFVDINSLQKPPFPLEI